MGPRFDSGLSHSLFRSVDNFFTEDCDLDLFLFNRGLFVANYLKISVNYLFISERSRMSLREVHYEETCYYRSLKVYVRTLN
jgi:hypothetical protein